MKFSQNPKLWWSQTNTEISFSFKLGLRSSFTMVQQL